MAEANMAMTVTGEVPVAELGVTLPHEHLIHRISIHSGKPDNTCIDTNLVAEELSYFRSAGGSTACDVTPIGVGRDPEALRELSRLSGVNIISALGLYQLDIWPTELASMSETALTDFLVREAFGESTGIAAGLLGEIACHNEDHADWRKYELLDKEKMVFRAVAGAQRRTGLTISTHASFGRAGVAQIEVLLAANADPGRIVIGHCGAQSHEDIAIDLEYYDTLLSEGVSLEFDLFGWQGMPPDNERCQRIAALVTEGFADRILLSTDTCRLSQLHRFGGRGFDYLFASVLPGLRDLGVGDEDIHHMTVTNPARIFTRLPY